MDKCKLLKKYGSCKKCVEMEMKYTIDNLVERIKEEIDRCLIEEIRTKIENER